MGDESETYVSLTTASSVDRRYSEHHGSGSNHGEQGRFEHEWDGTGVAWVEERM